MVETAFFYLFSGTLIGASAVVVGSRNPIYAVLFLILAFLNAAGLFLLAGAELLSMLLIIVYVGAVTVLFLFVVMMLGGHFSNPSTLFSRYKFIALLAGFILAGELVTASILWISHPKAVKPLQSPSITNAHAIGEILYTQYFYIFQLSGIILLVAMIGAIVLTLRKRSSAHSQNYQNQLKRSPKNSLEMVKTPSGEGLRKFHES